MKLGELGVVSLGMMKLGELGEPSFGMMKLGKLGELSFGKFFNEFGQIAPSSVQKPK